MKENARYTTVGRVRSLFFALLTVLGVCPAVAQEDELHTDGDNEFHLSRYYVSRAESYEQANAWESAKREIDAGLERYPDDPDLRYLNGRYYYYAQGDLHQARYNLVKAIQESDKHYRAKRVMVDVEDDSKHYSSAICYINELLEYQPYDRDLWRRKIALYNKIGHKVEADAALERLARIYPNDSVVRRDLSNRNRENWTRRLQKSSLSESAEALENWIQMDQRNFDYYIELMNIYYRMGDYERAINVANRGLMYFPRNQTLVRKAAGIMTEMGQYTRALSFARQHKIAGTLYSNLLRDVANDARMKDPYEANGRLYQQTGDRDALTYLLNTAITRGYFDDARVWLQEFYKKDGRTVRLLMKEYALEKRLGNEQATFRLLQEIYNSNPQDEELTEEYANMMLELANREIAQDLWADAEVHLRKAIEILQPDNESWPVAISRLITVLGRLNRFDDARELYNHAVTLTPSTEHHLRFGSAYEYVAGNRLKYLIEVERYDDALSEAQALLAVVPNSEAALRCCINMSQTLKRDELFYQYADMGYNAYPEMPYFIVKKAVALQQRDRSAEALALLRPQNGNNGYVNPQLVAAYSGITEEWATLLLQERMPDIAIEKIDTALVFDPKNKDLLYLKGLAYEQLKDFGQAYYYQSRYYNPSNAEQQDWYQHMRYMHFRSLKNHVDVSYTRAFYDTRQDDLASIGHLYSVASVAYSRLCKRNTYMGQISYKGIDGYHAEDEYESGGVGLEFMGQWDHTFNHRWSGMINASYSTRFFNKWGANVGLSYAGNNGWTPSLRVGYRRTPRTYLYLNTNSEQFVEHKKYHLFLVTPALEKAWERVRTSVSADLILMGKSFYYNVGWKGKLFVCNDNISSISLMAGFGSFPELSFFDQTALRNFSHTNAMLGFDAQWLVTYNFAIGLAGNWNTCYNPFRRADYSLADSYRNIYSINVQLHLAF